MHLIYMYVYMYIDEEKKDCEMRLEESQRTFLKEFKLMLMEGFRLQKHGRHGNPHFRNVTLSKDMSSLYWGSQKANSKFVLFFFLNLLLS